MAKASREKSKVLEMAENNIIFETWTQTNGLKIYPMYNIDKLKFSHIEIGKQGGGKSFDIYMDTMKDGGNCFDNWAYDILNDMRFEKIMMLEKKEGQKYPKYYKYITGENGDKSIGIANSINNNGYVVNMQIPNPHYDANDGKSPKTLYANIPVSYHDLRHIAIRYQMSYGSRMKELEALRKNAEIAINSKRTMVKERQVIGSSENSSEPQLVAAPEKKRVDCKLQIKGAVEEKEGGYVVVPAMTEELPEVKQMIFKKKDLKKLSSVDWNTFISFCMNGFSIDVIGHIVKSSIMFEGRKVA